MVRSNVKPDDIEIKRKRVTSEGLKVDLLIHWDINQIQVDDVNGETHTEYKYEEEEYTVTVDDNQQGAESFITDNSYLMKLKGKARREARTGDSIMTSQEETDLRSNRAKPGKGN